MRQVILGLMIAAGFLLRLPAAGQDTLEVFEAGFVDNLLRYEAGTETTANAAREAVQTTLESYRPLWDRSRLEVPFQTVVDVLDAYDPEAAADASIVSYDRIGGPYGDLIRTGTSACHVQVYARSAHPDDILPLLAHEMAHCYQHHYIPHTTGSGTGDPDSWWAEGTAEWLASLIYPSESIEAIGLGGAQAEMLYMTRNNQPLTDVIADTYDGYGSVYFWSFLASPLGIADPPALVDTIKTIPAAGESSETYQNFLNGILGDAPERMHAYGVALAQQSLSFQPTPAELFGAPVSGSVPFLADMAPDDYTVAFREFRFEPTAGVEAIEVRTNGLTDESVRVSVNGEGRRYTEIGDDRPLLLCLTETGVNARFVITRADGDAEMSFLLTMRPASGEGVEDCETPTLGETSSPDCLVGTWQLTSDPMALLAESTLSGGAMAASSPGITVVAIGADGSIAYSINNFILSIADPSGGSGGTMTMNAAMTGQLAFSDGGGGTFTVSRMDLTVQDLSVMASINGFEMDMTSVVLDVLDVGGFAPTPVQLACRSTTLDWVIHYDGGEYVWLFSRVE